jgi:hypothetical protein
VIIVSRDDTAAAQALIAELRELLDELRAERRAGHELLTDLRAAIKAAEGALVRITSSLSIHIEAELRRIVKINAEALVEEVNTIAAQVQRTFEKLALKWLDKLEGIIRTLGEDPGTLGAFVLQEPQPFLSGAARTPPQPRRGKRGRR